MNKLHCIQCGREIPTAFGLPQESGTMTPQGPICAVCTGADTCAICGKKLGDEPVAYRDRGGDVHRRCIGY